MFSSEIKAILASGLIGRKMNWRAFHDYLYFGNSLGAGTLLKATACWNPAITSCA